MKKPNHPKRILSEGIEYQIQEFSWSQPSKRRPTPGRYTSGIAHKHRYMRMSPLKVYEGHHFRNATILSAKIKWRSIWMLSDLFSRLNSDPRAAVMLTNWPQGSAILATDLRAGKVHFIIRERWLPMCSASDDHRHVKTRLAEWDFVMRTSLGDLVEQGEIDCSASFEPLIIRRPSFNVDYAWLTPASKLYR